MTQSFPKLMGPGLSTMSISRAVHAAQGEKMHGSLLCQWLFQEHSLGTKMIGSRRLGSQQAFGYKVGCKHRCCYGHRPPHFQPGLTSPFMSGFAPMACCIFFTSLVGPVMSDVPVSTMASQPPSHTLGPLATSTLGRDAQTLDNP